MVLKKCYSIRNKSLDDVETNFWDPFLRFPRESVIQEKTRKTGMFSSRFFTIKSSNIFQKKRRFLQRSSLVKSKTNLPKAKKRMVKTPNLSTRVKTPSPIGILWRLILKKCVIALLFCFCEKWFEQTCTPLCVFKKHMILMKKCDMKNTKIKT